MEKKAYQDMILQQEIHWWFKARKEIISKVLSTLNLPSNAEILEIGSGMGGNLSMLEKFGNVTAIEMDADAVKYTQEAYKASILQGSLPDNIPNADRKYDVVCLFDVLEHIDNDVEALESIKKLMKPGGLLILTVPAYQWLFGTHDKFLHHYRRYSRKRLLTQLNSSGLDVIKSGYFNFILFPLVVLVRLFDVLKRSQSPSGYGVPSSFVNFMFFNIFRIERFLIPTIFFPMGSSIMAIAKNKK